MAATYNKFNVFTRDALTAKHDFSSAVFKVMLSNSPPAATNAVKADIVEITAGNGYTAGGTATTISLSNTSGTEIIDGTSVTFTASGGSIGPFQYAALYNDTQTTPAKPLVCWFDNGAAVTVTTGNSATISFPSHIFTLV
jgi:hypothetical protein